MVQHLMIGKRSIGPAPTIIKIGKRMIGIRRIGIITGIRRIIIGTKIIGTKMVTSRETITLTISRCIRRIE